MSQFVIHICLFLVYTARCKISVKLLDYQDRWVELETSDNPFATVVMAHLKTQQTSKNQEERKKWKFTLIRRLYELGWQETDIKHLYRFIDWTMLLPKALESEFWQELKQFEQERKMAYITTGERIGEERGKQELILRQLKKRVGELSFGVIASVQALNVAKLEELGEALLDFTGIDDLLQWLEADRPE